MKRHFRWKMAILAYLAIIPALVMGETCIQSFHAGPGDELTLEDADGCCEEPVGTSGTEIVGYEQVQCPYCVEHNYELWCPHCGYCPMWDEIGDIGEWDNENYHPSTNQDPLIRQLEQ